MTATRDEFRAGVRALLPTLVGTLPFGLITGVAGTAAGLSPTETIGLSFITFSGIAQLVVCQLLATGSPAPVVMLAALVVSLRLMMYSAALAPYLGHSTPRWKLLLAYLTTDQGFAASVAHFQRAGGGDPLQQTERAASRQWFHLGGGISQWLPWQIFVIIGALVGARVPAAWSLDFAVPLTFLAMLIPAIRNRGTAIATVVAGAVSLAAAGLPFRLSLIVASLAGIAAGFLTDRGHRYRGHR